MSVFGGFGRRVDEAMMRPAALVLLCAVTILAVKRDASSGRSGNCSWDVLEQLRGRLDQRATAAARRLLVDGLLGLVVGGLALLIVRGVKRFS